MKYLKVLFLLLFIKLVFAGELNENNGASEYYHQKLHIAEGAYLVRYERVTHTPGCSNPGRSKDKIEISAIIEKAFKGEKKIDDEIVFNRLYDSNKSRHLPVEGQRFIVFFDTYDGEWSIDPQDPASVWADSSEINTFLTDHIE